MKTIRKPRETILKILGSSIPETGKELHLSQFTVSAAHGENTYLVNTFTGETVVFDTIPIPSSLTVTEDIYNNDLLLHLIKNHYYVPADTDEAERYCRIISIIRAIKAKKGITTYTILPTTSCNARCFYCFELNYRFIDMNNETIDKTIDFIRSTHSDETLKIDWFGGEPLLGLKQIRRITDSLNKDGIQFRSNIVTNGSLFTESLITEAKEKWHLKRAQITLDGQKKTYCSRKNYIDLDESVYETVIANILLLLKNGISVMIRMNMDSDNIEELYRLADELDERINERKNLTVHVSPLITEQTRPIISSLWKECMKLEKYLSSLSFNTLSRSPEVREYYCIAHNPAAVTINADGNVYSCNHCLPDAKLGSLDTVLSKRKQAAELSDIRMECRQCPWLPDCTEFDQCPDRTGDCRLIHEIQLKRSLCTD